MKKSLLVLAVIALAGVKVYAQEADSDNTPAKWSVGINLAEAVNFGTPAIEAGVGLNQTVSLHIGGRYNNWAWGNGDNIMQNRKRTAWLGVRYWPWNVNSGWWIQAKGQYNEVNSNLFMPFYTDPVTGVSTRKKVEGDMFGGGIAFGYAVMLAKHLNLEFGLGAWAGIWTDYRVYAKAIGGRLIPEECADNKFFILPDQVQITLQFVF